MDDGALTRAQYNDRDEFEAGLRALIGDVPTMGALGQATWNPSKTNTDEQDIGGPGWEAVEMIAKAAEVEIEDPKGRCLFTRDKAMAFMEKYCKCVLRSTKGNSDDE